jgi:hypothetical protein
MLPISNSILQEDTKWALNNHDQTEVEVHSGREIDSDTVIGFI